MKGESPPGINEEGTSPKVPTSQDSSRVSRQRLSRRSAKSSEALNETVGAVDVRLAISLLRTITDLATVGADRRRIRCVMRPLERFRRSPTMQSRFCLWAAVHAANRWLARVEEG
jgi:hypothetical protein